MYIKLLNKSTVIGNVYCCNNFTEYLDDSYEEEVKLKVKEGYEILVRSEGEWVKGKEYFKIEETDNDEIDFNNIFDGHWKKQVERVKQLNDLEVVKESLEYAKENDITDGVIVRIEKYIEELENK